MSKSKITIIVASLIAILAFFTWSVYDREQLRANGKLVLLELRPVDPRSLMQGDYMELSYSYYLPYYDLANYAVLRCDTLSVATVVRLQSDPTPLAEDEFLIKYNFERAQLHLGTNTYLFQEGQGDYFARARYGGLRIDSYGNASLIGLYDSTMQLMTAEKAVLYIDSVELSKEKKLDLE